MDLTVMKHKADTPDARIGIIVSLQFLLAAKSLPNPILKNKDRSATHK